MPKEKNDDHFDEYVKYVTTSRGTPEDFEDWAIDNNIKLPDKRKRARREDEYDDSE